MMSNAVPPKSPPPAVPEYSLMAGVLSYLVPGLGQIVQGRIGKGILFLFCIYVLFFRGMQMGTASTFVDNEEYRLGGNVYLPDNAEKANAFGLPRTLANLYNRPQFLAQFWVGIVVWPAIWQYLHYDERAEAHLRGQIHDARNEGMFQEADALEKRLRDGDPLFGHFERTPSEEANNAVQNAGDKLFELGWVYTVIAGVLNIMVIYDAMAGPAFPATRELTSKKALV